MLCSVTLPRWGTMRRGELSPRPMPSGLAEYRKLITSVIAYGLAERAPTPTVNGNYNRKGLSPTSGDGLATYVQRSQKSFPVRVPTPTASMVTTGDMEQSRYSSGQRPEYAQVNGGSLNPDWVEWLMGWPIGWTRLEPLPELREEALGMEPADVPRVAVGVDNRTARLKCIGNGQVPQAAEIAWRILTTPTPSGPFPPEQPAMRPEPLP